MAPGGPKQVPGWFMKAMGGVGQPTNDLSLRFQMFLAIGRSELTFSNVCWPSYALALRLCSEIVPGRVWDNPWLIVFYRVWALGGNL